MNQLNPVNILTPCAFEIDFSIVLTSTPRSPEWFYLSSLACEERQFSMAVIRLVLGVTRLETAEGIQFVIKPRSLRWKVGRMFALLLLLALT